MQLQDLSSELGQTITTMSEAAKLVETQMLWPPGQSITKGEVYRLGQGRQNWEVARRKVQQINDAAYASRPINLTSLTDPSYLSFAVQGEDVFKGDVENTRAFRMFHYVNESALREASSTHFSLRVSHDSRSG